MLASRLLIFTALIAVGCSPQATPVPEPSIPAPEAVAEPIVSPDVVPAAPGPEAAPPLRPEPSPPAMPPEPAAPEAPEPRPRGFYMADEWVGRWEGPEGLYLHVTPGEATNTVRLALKDRLDGEREYLGVLIRDGIRFERAGAAEVIRHGSGSETGFSALRSRTDCLIVRSGEEGYCRPDGRPRWQ